MCYIYRQALERFIEYTNQGSRAIIISWARHNSRLAGLGTIAGPSPGAIHTWDPHELLWEVGWLEALATSNEAHEQYRGTVARGTVARGTVARGTVARGTVAPPIG